MASKSKKSRDKQSDAISRDKNKLLKEILPVLPLAFILFAVPLIVYAKVIPAIDAFLFIQEEGSLNLNTFTHYRGIWFLVATAVSLLIVVGQKLKGELKVQQTHLMYPVILFSVLAILSTVFSEYPSVSLMGYPTQSEGLFMLLGYCAAFFAAAQLVKTPKHYQLLLGSFWASSMVMTLIGMLQAFGRDPFQTQWGQRLILPSMYHDYIDEMILMGGTRDVFLTMGNSNFAGGYMAIALSVFMGLMILTPDRRIKVVLMISNILMAGTLMMTGSRAGYVAMVISIFFLAAVLWHQIRENLRLLAAILAVLVIASAAFSMIAPRSFYQGLLTIADDIVTKSEPYPTNVKDLEFSENGMAVIGTEETLKIRMDGEGNQEYLDESERRLQWQEEVSPETGIEEHIVTTPSHSHYSITWVPHDQGERVTIHNGLVEAQFFYHEKHFYLIGRHGELAPYEPVESFGFEGRERMGTFRGYIWSRSIPLLKDTMLIGNGPDTFIYYFPQFDYLAMLQNKTRAESVRDKPHNFYLQTAINTGVISLGALLTLFGMYLFRSFRKYYREGPVTWQNQYGISILAGCVAYLTAGIFNDSVVGVSAVFWVLLGMGVALLAGENQSDEKASTR